MKKPSPRGVGDPLGSKKLVAVPEPARYQKVPALAKPLGTKGRRPRVDHASLGVGDAMTDQIAGGLALGKKKPAAAKGKAGLKISKEKPPKSRNPEAPRVKPVKAAAPVRPGGAVMGLKLPPRREAVREEGPSFRAEPLEAGRSLAARPGKEPAFQPRPGALAATPYSPQVIVLGMHRLVPHEGGPRDGKGSEKPEFGNERPVTGGKR